MAVTHIHKIKSTLNLAIDYIMKDKECIVIIDGKEEQVTFETITSGVNVNPKNAYKAFMKVKELHNKTDGNMAYHLWQNFGEDIDPQIAHEIGRKLARELFSAYQVVISTHTDGFVHNHFMINSVAIADGRKYNDSLATYKRIRQTSDRLCKEYGLKVLEHTQDFNLKRYIDDNGNVKFFEPTERKMSPQPDKFATANDYRNTAAYEKIEERKRTNRDTIRRDIERLIPVCSDYNELLRRLRKDGYTVRAKTKKGNWYKHISYKAPGQDKPTREDWLGSGYLREEIEERIKLYRTNTRKNHKYNIDIIRSMDRKELTDNTIKEILVNETCKLDSQVQNSIRNAQNDSHMTIRKSKTDLLMEQINRNIWTLNFIEEKNIQTFEEINQTVSGLLEKKKQAYGQLRQVELALEKMYKNVSLINAVDELKGKSEMTPKDISMLESAETILKLHVKGDHKDYIQSYAAYNNSFEKMKKQFDNISEQLQEFEICIKALHEADKTNNFATYIEEYQEIKQGQDEHEIEK